MCLELLLGSASVVEQQKRCYLLFIIEPGWLSLISNYCIFVMPNSICSVLGLEMVVFG